MGRFGHGWCIFSLVAACILALSVVASATTYYIDYAAGSDSANGTSPTAPWQHMPGMQGCTGNCAKTTPKAGDKIILKGGVTWPNAAFPITWTWSGTSGSPIYIGVDQTWYSGGSWTRPIFNAGGTDITGTVGGTVTNNYWWSPSVSYVTWDNIELTGWHVTFVGGVNPYAYGRSSCGYFSGTTYVTLSNLYVHGWSHSGTLTSGNAEGFLCIVGYGGTTPQPGDRITHMVFDGSDSITGGTSGMMTYAWPSITYSVCHDTPNCLMLAGDGEVAYNLIYNINEDFDAYSHANAIESLGSDSSPFYIHDNVIHDMQIGESMMIGNPNEIDYVWNNVIYNLLAPGANPPTWPQNGTSGTALYIWNNTVVPLSGNQCFIQSGSSYYPTLYIQNNYCISTIGLSVGITTPSAVITNNVTQTPTVANGQGYTSTQTYVYSPTASSKATVGAGTNLTSSWPTGYSTNDTSYACTQNAANQSVCPARPTVSRGATWDAGAYRFASGMTVPTNLTATVH